MHRFLLLLVFIAQSQLARAQVSGLELAHAAAQQVGVTVIYDGSYQGLEFPGGDIDRVRGVCTDVLIRALRDAGGIDLQLTVNRDMKADFAAYPTIWGLSSTDRNIDHRRVPNLETLLTRMGASLERRSDPSVFQTGDIVSWRLSGNNLPHIGIIAEATGPNGVPLVTHNIGRGTRTEDILFAHPITGHFRLTPNALQRLAKLGR